MGVLDIGCVLVPLSSFIHIDAKRGQENHTSESVPTATQTQD